ncbi:MAG: DUF927 domain-containing protein [Paracoccaceae bacterium]
MYLLGNGKDEEPTWLCSLLKVKALFRDASSRGWGRIVEIIDCDGRPQSVALPESEIESSPMRVRACLADRGLRLQDGRRAHQAFHQLIKGWMPRETLTSTDRLGWSDRSCTAFVCEDGRIIGSGQFHYIGQRSSEAAGGLISAGSVGDWRDKVAGLCRGNPLLVLAVSLAFSGPLLELLGEDGGGLRLRGASSCGKSTVQRVATSVWRNPEQIGSWRRTANGAEQAAMEGNSTLLALDEIAEISGKDLCEAVYMLANGVGKRRAKSSGWAGRPADWRVAILSTGEISVAEKISEAGSRYMAGHDVRLLDIEADGQNHGAFDNFHGSATGAAFSERLKRAALQNHGTAGRAFVEKLKRQWTVRTGVSRDITAHTVVAFTR